MNAPAKIEVPTGLALLRAPFPEHQISKLPKETKRQAEERKAGNNITWKCEVCGGMHHNNAVHLDYVGHAALTDRLLDADPEYSCEPMAHGPNGLPVFDQNGGLWVRLTVCGVTRMGYGDADGKTGGNAVKEAIGDAMRNAAMRFGAALDLWHKGDLHADDGETEGQSKGAVSPQSPEKPARGSRQSGLKTAYRQFVHELNGCGDSDELNAYLATFDALRVVEAVKEKLPHWWDGMNWPETEERMEEFEPLCDLLTRRQRECAERTASYLGV